MKNSAAEIWPEVGRHEDRIDLISKHTVLWMMMNHCVKVACFRHLRRYVFSERESQCDVSKRVNTFGQYGGSSPESCGATIPRRLISKICRIVFRSTAMYSSKCWPLTEKDGMRSSVMETEVLRWCLGIRCFDRVTNETTRKAMGIAAVKDTLRERHLG